MFVKLYSSIILSSIWSTDPEVRVLWITMLAQADKDGYLYGSPAGLAAVARLPLDSVMRGLEVLSSPDEYSGDKTRAPENDGRRIEVVDGGWRLLNYGFYRDLHRQDDRRQQWAESKARARLKGVDSPQMSRDVSESPPSDADSDADSDAEQEKMQATLPGVPAAPPLDLVGQAPPKVREPKPRGTRASKPPVYLNPPSMAEVEEFVRLRYPKANAKDFAFRFVRKQTEIEWRDKQGRPLRNWKATVDNWMDFEEVARFVGGRKA